MGRQLTGTSLHRLPTTRAGYSSSDCGSWRLSNPTFRSDVALPLTELTCGEHWMTLRLMERLGAGSSGEVWRAWDSRLERAVALKLLPLQNDKGDTARLVIEEGRLLARVRHPQVVTIHGAESSEGRVGLWMELVEGDDLETLLRRGGRLGPHEVAAIGVDLCAALQAVHDAGVLHRDVKAQNVRRTPQGRIVLMDFGSGRELDVLAQPTSDFSGTPLYLAPEVFAGGHASPQSDIYSLGVLLFHLLTGQFPVRGRTLHEIVDAHRQEKRTRLREVRPSTPRSLGRTIERALASDPSARFQTAGDLGHALLRSDPRRRKLRMAYAAAAVGAAVVVMFGIRGWRAPERATGGPSATDGGIVQRQLKLKFRPVILGAPSPDGRLLSYTDRDTGNLAVVDLLTDATREVTMDANVDRGDSAYASTFSYDGRRIAYGWFAHDCSCIQLRTVSVDGGRPVTLDTYPGVEDFFPSSWSRDGRYIATWVAEKTSTYQFELFDVKTSKRRVIGPGAGSLTSFSSDGRYVVFAGASSADRMAHDIYIADVGTGRFEALITGPGDKSFPLWSADGEHIVFLNRGTDTIGLWSQSVQSGRPVNAPNLITKNIGAVFPLGLTTSGSYYYMVEAQASDVYVARVNMTAGAVLEPPRRIASSVGSSEAPEWSPDGRFLAWKTIARPPGIVIQSLDVPGERKLDLTLSVGPNARWSPDGRSLLIRASDAREGGLYLVDIGNGTRRGPFLKNQPFGDVEWEPHGRSALVLRWEKGVTRLNFESGNESSVFMPPEGWSHGRGIAISPDGKRLAVNLIRENVIAITIAGLDGTPNREVVRCSSRTSLRSRNGRATGNPFCSTRRARSPMAEPSRRTVNCGQSPQTAVVHAR